MTSSTSDDSSRNGGAKKDVAVYIDYENLYISLRSTTAKNPAFDVIMEKCRDWGRLTVARAYADWSEFARVLTSQMFSSGVEPIYVPTRKFYDAKTRSQATKNSVDIHITIDIIKDVLLSKNIDIFVLVSGDRDFVPLMNQIRAAGKEVYAIGVAGCTSSELAVAVDEMFYYHQLLESEEDLAAEQADVYSRLVRAIEIARLRGYRPTLGVVKPIMREIVVGFNEREFRDSKGRPFQKFKEFAQEAERQGFIRCMDSGGSLELALARDAKPGAGAGAGAGQAGGRRSTRSDGRASKAGSSRRGSGRGAGRGQESASTETEAEAEKSESSEAAEASETTPRRSRRGGRRRRGRSGAAEAGAADAAGDAASGADDGEDDDAATTKTRAAEATTDDRDADEAPPARPRRRRRSRASEDEADEKRSPAPTTSDDDAPAEPASDDETAAEEQALPADLELPSEAFDDLKAMLETFGGRSPSQRRLIARLKKGAASGELKGSYQDGQFLLIVRKALEDELLERVPKGFYSGLKWREADSASAS